MRRLSGARVGATAKKVWTCKSCGLWHETKPTVCHCSGKEFEFFHSKGEARRWSEYLVLQRTGIISKLRRQVDLPLVAHGPTGEGVQWGKLVVDYAYVIDGKQRYADYKPRAGMTPEAALKIASLRAQGIIVENVT